MDSFIYYVRSKEQSGDSEDTVKKEEVEVESSTEKVEGADKQNDVHKNADGGTPVTR